MMEETIKFIQTNLRSSPTTLATLESMMETNSFEVAAISDPLKKLRWNKNYKSREFKWLSTKEGEAWSGILLNSNLKHSSIYLYINVNNSLDNNQYLPGLAGGHQFLCEAIGLEGSSKQSGRSNYNHEEEDRQVFNLGGLQRAQLTLE